VQVIQFLSPETFGLDSHRMATRLPKPACTISTSGLTQNVRETLRRERFTMVRQCSPSEFPEFRQGIDKLWRPVRCMEDDGMKMGRHHDKSVRSQSLVFVTICEAVGDDGTCPFGREDGQPVNHAECHKIHRSVVGNAVSFHEGCRRCGVRRPAHSLVWCGVGRPAHSWCGAGSGDPRTAASCGRSLTEPPTHPSDRQVSTSHSFRSRPSYRATQSGWPFACCSRIISIACTAATT
jgi:hypothetical protein